MWLSASKILFTFILSDRFWSDYCRSDRVGNIRKIKLTNYRSVRFVNLSNLFLYDNCLWRFAFFRIVVENVSICCPCYSYLKVYLTSLEQCMLFPSALLWLCSFIKVEKRSTWQCWVGYLSVFSQIILVAFLYSTLTNGTSITQPLVPEKCITVRTQGEITCNMAVAVIVYSYNQDRIFMCNVLVSVFLERNRLISGKHIIFGLYMKYNRFFCFLFFS